MGALSPIDPDLYLPGYRSFRKLDGAPPYVASIKKLKKKKSEVLSFVDDTLLARSDRSAQDSTMSKAETGRVYTLRFSALCRVSVPFLLPSSPSVFHMHREASAQNQAEIHREKTDGQGR